MAVASVPGLGLGLPFKDPDNLTSPETGRLLLALLRPRVGKGVQGEGVLGCGYIVFCGMEVRVGEGCKLWAPDQAESTRRKEPFWVLLAAVIADSGSAPGAAEGR